jgi:hypothetical protein
MQQILSLKSINLLLIEIVERKGSQDGIGINTQIGISLMIFLEFLI